MYITMLESTASQSRTLPFIAAYIPLPLLSQYYSSHIVNPIIPAMYHDAIPYLMSSSFRSLLSVSSMAVEFIALQHTYGHEPVLILLYMFHIPCFYFPYCLISYYTRLFLT